MSPEALRDLQYRCRRAIAAPIPQHIREGGARAAADYKQCAAVCAAFLRTGAQAEKARVHVLRLEGMQGVGEVAQFGDRGSRPCYLHEYFSGGEWRPYGWNSAPKAPHGSSFPDVIRWRYRLHDQPFGAASGDWIEVSAACDAAALAASPSLPVGNHGENLPSAPSQVLV